MIDELANDSILLFGHEQMKSEKIKSSSQGNQVTTLEIRAWTTSCLLSGTIRPVCAIGVEYIAGFYFQLVFVVYLELIQ